MLFGATTLFHDTFLQKHSFAKSDQTQGRLPLAMLANLNRNQIKRTEFALRLLEKRLVLASCEPYQSPMLWEKGQVCCSTSTDHEGDLMRNAEESLVSKSSKNAGVGKTSLPRILRQNIQKEHEFLAVQ